MSDLEGIKVLRQKTQAGLMDCRRALAEARGNPGEAEDLLKAWGLVALEKRADRATPEGRVFIHEAQGRAAMVELDCETDFVALNGAFRATGAILAKLAWEGELEAPDPETLALVADLGGVIKENLVLRRITSLGPKVAPFVATYLHPDGRIGVVLGARAERTEAFEDARILAFLHDLCLQVAAFGPAFVDGATVDPAYIEERLSSYREEVAAEERLQGKPEAMLEGIVAGKLRKHLSEASLLGHGFVRDEKLPVSAVLAELEARTGYGLGIVAFACFKVGEEAPGRS